MGCLFIVLVCVLLFAYRDSRPNMRKRFGDGQRHVLTDSNGNKYVVSHNLCDTYFLRPVE